MKKFFINSLILSVLFSGLQISNNFASAQQNTCTPTCTGTGVGTAKPITCCPGKTYTCTSKIICCEKDKPGCYEKKKCNVGSGSCK